MVRLVEILAVIVGVITIINTIFSLIDRYISNKKRSL